MSFFLSCPLILDGATGTNLIKAGMSKGDCPERWILEHPQVLVRLQQEYIEAGSEMILAPTFGANRVRLGQYGLEDHVEDYCAKLASLSIKATKNCANGKRVFIAGDVSPCGLFPKPFGENNFEEIYQVYLQQVMALKAAGVDLIYSETNFALSDCRAVLMAAKHADLPCFITITLDENQRTMSGLSLESAVVVLQSMGADAVGLNCSQGPEQMVQPIRAAAPYARVPLIAKPNAGMPNEGVYHMEPEEFSRLCGQLAAEGASVLGGCCGTTPVHIKALSETAFQIGQPAKKKPDAFAANERSVFDLSEEILLSSPIMVDDDLSENFMEGSLDEEFNTFYVSVEKREQFHVLLDALPFAKKALCFECGNIEVLKACLFAYQGRAIVSNRNNKLSKTQLDGLSKQFGCIIV